MGASFLFFAPLFLALFSHWSPQVSFSDLGAVTEQSYSDRIKRVQSAYVTPNQIMQQYLSALAQSFGDRLPPRSRTRSALSAR